MRKFTEHDSYLIINHEGKITDFIVIPSNWETNEKDKILSKYPITLKVQTKDCLQTLATFVEIFR